MKFSTKTTSIHFLLNFLFLVSILAPHNLIAQTCPETLSTSCSGTGFITVNADFDSSAASPHSDDCPTSIMVSDGTITATLTTGGAPCSAGIGGTEGYFVTTPAGFDCSETAISVSMAMGGGGTLSCNYDIPGGMMNMTPDNAVLPVELISFNASLQDKTVALHWETASEINNKIFTIEKSADGRAFSTIGEMAGAGVSFETLKYVFVDKEPTNGKNYYRLTQTDFDGHQEQFEIIVIEFSEGGQISTFPNPVDNVLRIGTTATFQDKPADIYIQDLSGKVVFQTQEWITDGPVEVDLSNLTSGMYVLSMTVESKVFNKKIVKN